MFHENRLLADDSHEVSLFFRRLGKMSKNVSSAAVVICALRANRVTCTDLSKMHSNETILYFL